MYNGWSEQVASGGEEGSKGDLEANIEHGHTGVVILGEAAVQLGTQVLRVPFCTAAGTLLPYLHVVYGETGYLSGPALWIPLDTW